MRTTTLLTVGLVAFIASGPCCATTTPEAESNDTKTTANTVLGMVAGDTITGMSGGATGANLDFFDITLGAAPVAIYRHRLVLSDADGRHRSALMGLNQANGVPTTTETSLQGSSGTEMFVQWYGFGRQERIIYRASALPTTAVNYTVTLQTQAVTPVVVPGAVAAGPVTIRVSPGAADAAINADFWVYDSFLTPLPDFGHDETDAAGATRTLTAGTYYLAVGQTLYSNMVSPADDANRNGLLSEYPDCLVTGLLSTIPTPITCEITGIDGTVTTPAVTLAGREVIWYQFTVGGTTTPTPPTGVGASLPTRIESCAGAAALLTVGAAPGANPPSTGVTVTADLSGVGGSASQPFFDDATHGDAASGDGVFSWLAPIPPSVAAGTKAIPFTVADAQSRSTSASFAFQVAPCGDTCGNATPVAIGANPFSTYGAASHGGCGCGGIDVFSTFTPPESRPYQFSNCGSNYSTCLAIFAGSCANPECLDGVYTDCGMTTLNLTAGETYTIRAVGGSFPNTSGVLTILPTTTALALTQGTFSAAELTTARMVTRVTRANPPLSTSLSVTVDLSALGGPGGAVMYDDGTHGDTAGGDLLYTLEYPLTAVAVGWTEFPTPMTVTDGEGRSATAPSVLRVTEGPSGSCCAAGVCIVTRQAPCLNAAGLWWGSDASCGGDCSLQCDPIDFNRDGLYPDTTDIDDFLSVFSGGPCSTGPDACGDIDYNNDGLFPDTADIDALLSIFSGGPCT